MPSLTAAESLIATPSLPTKETLSIVVVSFFVHACVYLLASKFSSNLSRRDAANFKSRIVSTAHAIYCSFAYLFVFLSDENLYWRHKYLYSLSIASPLFAISLGYFLFDTWIMLVHRHDPDMGSWPMFAHHVLALLSCSVFLSYQNFIILGASSLGFTEATTPFTNIRWILEKKQMKDSLWYSLNGLCMFLGFWIFRIGFSIFSFVIVLRNFSDVMSQDLFVMPLTLFTVCALSFLNIMWTWKVTQGALKLFLNSRIAKKAVKAM
mmetsp:Transcript_11380/g.42723  ORF Transcript_11380/g.42723 Transcript_11380/m.42723 type:complete len:265 (-) Transcript_11380:153-947(-)|eukprot:CAMPEP_0117444970 /NCGR_PEP_ID=MMETSP0759-20121206/5538_1 /TAXON_ID=63605 /ORGANISM="Percolomonas cosmopolitus, Strain WS" /LENGTH=264 /DNA_ID=CAMNT_0005237099 /DNA_START=20 /DNA_END=814 /DNA_ORIENTATION=+